MNEQGFIKQKKRALLILATLIILAVLIVMLPKYFFLDEKDIIKQQLKSAVSAVESKDADKLSAVLSDNYEGYYADSKERAIQMASSEFNNFDKVNIKINKIDIELNADSTRANVKVEFFVSGVYTGFSVYKKLPFQGLSGRNSQTPDVVELGFKEDSDGEWRVMRAEFKTGILKH